MDTVKGYIGVVVDTSLLLLQLEQQSGEIPQRIHISFNGYRYDPRTNGAKTGRQPPSPESPFRRAYNVEMNLASTHGFPAPIKGRENLPTESTSSRIPVSVSSFPDPAGKAVMAKAEEVVLRDGQAHTILHRFEFTSGTWKLLDSE